MPTVEQLKGTAGVLVNVVRCAHLKRALAEVDADPPLNFWRIMHGSLLDVAVMDWCKLFGSDDEEHQQVHWRNVVLDHGAFRAGLLAHLGVTYEVWCSYWRQMKGYRDYHVAHLDFKKRRDITHYPVLDHAVASCCFYYGKVVEELHRCAVDDYPGELQAYAERFHAQALQIARTAVAGTDQISEAVY